MASLEQAVRKMLTEASSLNSLDDSAITHGYRLFGQTLPAVTFELEQTVDESLAQEVRSVVVRASYIAATTKDAADALSNLRERVRARHARRHRVLPRSCPGGHTIEETVATDGDEQSPAILNYTCTLYYEE
jgi:hypothetical protein